jgi:hypothetical protein
MDEIGWSAVPEEEVPERLQQLGVSEEILRSAVDAGVQQASGCTSHDPQNLGGILIWGKGMRELRDRLVVNGWKPRDTRGFPTATHPTGSHQIAIAAGTADTGRRTAIPRTRRAKGIVTAGAVAGNQLTLADLDAWFEPTDPDMRVEQTWFLLHYVDELADEVRLELSLPGEMKDGHITGWLERVILRPLPGAPNIDLGNDEDDEPPIEVDVRPRA